MSSMFTQMNAQWTALFDLLQAQMNYGSGGAGTGTNTSGLLQTVASIGKSEWPEFNALPYVGVALKDWTLTEEYTGPRRKLVSVFQIVAVVDVVASGANVIKLADAYQKAMTVLDDGAGNGVMPIILADANYNLASASNPNGLASKIIPRKGRMDWANKPSGKGTDYVAYATVMLYVESYVG